MNKVCNIKEWSNKGWVYRMYRTVGGKRFGICVAISPPEIHYRDVVACRLRDARALLRQAISVCDADNT